MSTESLIRSLRQEIVFARQRIYDVGQKTPLQEITLEDFSLFVKREDISPINAYKWRGAYNRIAQLADAERAKGVVTASAGNHAQGVALAAHRLQIKATIFMPLATPRMKRVAVEKLGGDWVEIILLGDTYDAASSAAHQFAETHSQAYIHAYDDLAVMAGQGTLADEVVMSGKGPFDIAFLQVGGGGMAGATATWLKMNYPDIRIVGVEGIDQASMVKAVQAGGPVALDKVDIFCDGTAVRKVGQLTYQICAEMVDEWMTVSNDEVSASIQFLWEQLRCIPEPSGAMGVAGALKQRDQLAGKKVLCVLCGANMDFEQLALIAQRSAIGASRRRYLRIGIPEKPNAMYHLLEMLPESVNIVDFQYGKTDASQAYPVIGFDVSSIEFGVLTKALQDEDYVFTEVTQDTDVNFRLIPYAAELLSHPFFITLEFHERPGALADFLRAVSPYANLCYFNYVYSGERVGRALLCFEFADADAQESFPQILEAAEEAYRSYEILSPEVLDRILT